VPVGRLQAIPACGRQSPPSSRPVHALVGVPPTRPAVFTHAVRKLYTDNVCLTVIRKSSVGDATRLRGCIHRRRTVTQVATRLMQPAAVATVISRRIGFTSHWSAVRRFFSTYTVAGGGCPSVGKADDRRGTEGRRRINGDDKRRRGRIATWLTNGF